MHDRIMLRYKTVFPEKEVCCKPMGKPGRCGGHSSLQRLHDSSPKRALEVNIGSDWRSPQPAPVIGSAHNMVIIYQGQGRETAGGRSRLGNGGGGVLGQHLTESVLRVNKDGRSNRIYSSTRCASTIIIKNSEQISWQTLTLKRQY